MALRRIGIYGGTFDPVHNGHIEVAHGVQQLFELDQVIFVPACVPPHKRNAKITSAFHRFAMLALATGQDQNLHISTLELDAPELPYAVETVERMKTDSARLFFMIGADSWAEIPSWHEWRRLLQMCDLIVITRPGYEIDRTPARAADLIDLRNRDRGAVSEALEAKQPRVFLTNVAMIDISATRIRASARANDGAALRAMVPAAVAEYIEKYDLYRN